MTEQIETKRVATLEEIENWIDYFQNYCRALKVEVSPKDEEFLALEQAFWTGIVVSCGPQIIPDKNLGGVLFIRRSPTFDYKSAAKPKRVRRTKAEIEAAEAAAKADAVVDANVRDQRSDSGFQPTPPTT